ncbi:MAG: Hsp20/alpha crystallin family protein [Rhodothermia bacterium]|nr:Hsp20/alpha crystallin family protein [Rhodothermia bacterium]
MTEKITRAITPLRNLRREVDRLFSDVFSSVGDGEELMSDVWAPRMDMSEKDDTYVIRMDVPGVSRDGIKVDVTDHELTVSGERKETKRDEDENFLRVERTFGSFYRSVRLPKMADAEKVRATFKDGELIVRVPKVEEMKPRKIDVKVG